jgi:phenylacetate-CoA ligase
VEILDEAGEPCAPGVHGEITLTGGFNFCLPLLRYRTGDFAALDFSGPEPVLKEFTGRAPVRFRAANGTWVNSIDVNHALRDLPLQQFQLHQNASGAMQFNYDAEDVLDEAIARRLQPLFGSPSSPTITRTRFEGAKVVQYASAPTPS